MALEPVFEADFSQYSLGFRPNRRTMDATRYLQWSITDRKKFFWVIEGDISSYFDTIHHPKLIRQLGRRIKDKKLLRLTWKFLRAGVMEKRTFRDTKLGTPQGGIISPLLANIYLHELDRYMERYLSLSHWEKTKRRKAGMGNYTYVRYADDFIVLCNGTKDHVEELREELFQFLQTTLRLELSKEKTKITHVNDGFNFLGFRIQRSPGSTGKTTKIVIPAEAMNKVKAKLNLALSQGLTHQDSANTKIQAINRLIRGWCQYYQYTSKASTQFHQLDHDLFWKMAHWLGRKFGLSMPEVMRRFRQGNTFATKDQTLLQATEFPSLQYRERFFKPNPYLTVEKKLARENLPNETYWTGYESRPGMADLRPLIIERDEYTCQLCGNPISPQTAQVDHIRPVERFKRPIDANVEWNLWTLCISCHKSKTKIDRQVESRVR
jgi:RNA-directed DNA polymerase